MADLLGIDVDTLGEQLRNGDTLAAIAEQNGVDTQVVVDFIVENTTERIDQAVENGRIDAAVAEERLADLEANVTIRVNEGRPERGDGEGFGPRG